jgi:hypothetical protein
MNKTVWFGLLAIVLALGMVFVGCDNGSTNGGNGGQNLPAASGANDVGGKTYYESSEKIFFSATDEDALGGSYTIGRVVWDDENDEYELVNGKYKYTDVEIGAYSWNEQAKTVTLKPEKVSLYGIGDENNENAFENELLDKTACKTALRSFFNQMIQQAIQENGQQVVNQQLKSMGFSSVDAYLNYVVNEMVNEFFAIKTNVYSFSTDETALFLEKALPKNIGTNEFSGQTYYGMTLDEVDGEYIQIKDENRKYVFTASGYTCTYSYNGTVSETITGSDAFDSSDAFRGYKVVWLRPEKINGKDRSAYYAEQTAYSGHYYPDNNACRAAYTNGNFETTSRIYNSTNKIIGG